MNLRGLAAQGLSRVIHDGHSLTAVLDNLLPKLKDHQDRAFVQALCYGVIRHYFALDFMLQQLLDKPLKPKDGDIQALILVGLYQLQHMRVKAHAAVSETVAATRHKPWAKSLVNAVLRRYLREAETLQNASQMDKQSTWNHPLWIVEQLQADWEQQTEQILLANDQPAPMAIRVNLLRCTREQYLLRLEQFGIEAQLTPCSEAGLILDQPLSVDLLPGFADGLVSVQDAAAQLAAGLLNVKPGQTVLDMCAAPGGKTAAILERHPGLHSLLAIDIDSQRLQRVTQNLERLGLQADTLVADASLPASWAAGSLFDCIVLDAPCSGLGVIRRHPDIKLLRRYSDISRLQALQARLLDAAWSLLATGGQLLYVTCSVLKQENEAQVAAFLERHSDAVEWVIEADWGMPRPHGRQILPGSSQMDGFYYARLCKAV